MWELLVRTNREVVSASELTRMAGRLNLNAKNATDHMRRAELLMPLFRGTYYVRTPEEVRLSLDKYNPFELFAMAAEAKRIGPWYFGLDTALRLNGMTHEDLGLETVISEKLYRIKGVPIGRRRFVIHKWAPKLLTFGLIERAPYRYSDPEKTVLDLAYLDTWTLRRARPDARTWTEHIGSVDARRLSRYLRRYPDRVRELVEASP